MSTGEIRKGPPPIPPEALMEKKKRSPELKNLLTDIIDAQPPKQERTYNLTEETKLDDAEHLQATGTLVEGEPVGFFAYDGKETIRKDRVQHEIHVTTGFAEVDSITRSGVKDKKRGYSEDGHSARIDRDSNGRNILTLSVIDGAGSTGNGAVGAKTINQLLEQHLTTFKPGQSDIERVIKALWKTDQEAAKQFGTKEAYACVACGQIIEEKGKTYGIFSNIGDSRVQIVRGKKIIKLSDLQNLPNFLAASSQDRNVNPNDRYNEQNGNVITAALGKLKDKENPYSFGMTERDYKQYLLNKENNDPNIQFTTPNIIMVDLEPGDRVIMYGDGLSDIQDAQVLAEESAQVTNNSQFVQKTFAKARDIGEQKTPQTIEGYNRGGQKEKIKIGKEGKYVNGDDLTIMSVEIKGTPSNIETPKISYETKQRAALQASIEKEQREAKALQDVRKNIRQMNGVATLETAANNVISSLTDFGVSLAGDIEKNINQKLADLQAIMSNEQNKNIVSKTWDTIKGFFNRKKETALTEAQKQYDQLSSLLETYKNTKLPTQELSGEWEKIKTTLETQSTEAIKSVLANMKALAKKYGAQYDKRVAYVEQLLAQRAYNTSTETPLPQNVQGDFEVEDDRTYNYQPVLDNSDLEITPINEYLDAEDKKIYDKLTASDQDIVDKIIDLIASGKNTESQIALQQILRIQRPDNQPQNESNELRNQLLSSFISDQSIEDLLNKEAQRKQVIAKNDKRTIETLKQKTEREGRKATANVISIDQARKENKERSVLVTAQKIANQLTLRKPTEAEPNTQLTYGKSLGQMLYRYEQLGKDNIAKKVADLTLENVFTAYKSQKRNTYEPILVSSEKSLPPEMTNILRAINSINGNNIPRIQEQIALFSGLDPQDKQDIIFALKSKDNLQNMLLQYGEETTTKGKKELTVKDNKNAVVLYILKELNNSAKTVGDLALDKIYAQDNTGSDIKPYNPSAPSKLAA